MPGSDKKWVLCVCAAGLFIFGVRLWLLSEYFSPLLLGDQWYAEGMQILKPFLQGKLTFADMFRPYLLHPIIGTRTLMLVSTILNGQWDPVVMSVASNALHTLSGVLLMLFMGSLFDSRVRVWIIGCLTVFWSVPYDYEAILHAQNNCYYFMVFFALIALYGLLHNPFSLRWNCGAVAALIACFCMRSGFLAAAVVAIMQTFLIIVDGRERRKRAITLGMCAVCFIVSYAAFLRVPVTGAGAMMTPAGVGGFFAALGKAVGWTYSRRPVNGLFVCLPFLILIVTALVKRRNLPLSMVFTLCLGGYGLAQSAALAYGRGGLLEYFPGSTRYLAFLVLGTVASIFSFVSLGEMVAVKYRPWFTRVCALWVIIFGFQFYGYVAGESLPEMRSVRDDCRRSLVNVRSYLSGSGMSREEFVKLTPFREIPHNNAQELVGLLADMDLKKVYPPAFTVPGPATEKSNDGGFVVDGLGDGMANYYGEKVWGSFTDEGEAAVGNFESLPMRLSRPVLAIPVAGYLNRKGLTLSLVMEDGKKIKLKPRKKADEKWQVLYVRNPGKGFRIVASDNSEKKWFAFATPRGVGYLSWISDVLIHQARYFMMAGVFLLVFVSSDRLFAGFFPSAGAEGNSSGEQA